MSYNSNRRIVWPKSWSQNKVKCSKIMGKKNTHYITFFWKSTAFSIKICRNWFFFLSTSLTYLFVTLQANAVGLFGRFVCSCFALAFSVTLLLVLHRNEFWASSLHWALCFELAFLVALFCWALRFMLTLACFVHTHFTHCTHKKIFWISVYHSIHVCIA